MNGFEMYGYVGLGVLLKFTSTKCNDLFFRKKYKAIEVMFMLIVVQVCWPLIVLMSLNREDQIRAEYDKKTNKRVKIKTVEEIEKTLKDLNELESAEHFVDEEVTQS
jgi:hypothetical protein